MSTGVNSMLESLLCRYVIALCFFISCKAMFNFNILVFLSIRKWPALQLSQSSGVQVDGQNVENVGLIGPKSDMKPATQLGNSPFLTRRENVLNICQIRNHVILLAFINNSHWHKVGSWRVCPPWKMPFWCLVLCTLIDQVWHQHVLLITFFFRIICGVRRLISWGWCSLKWKTYSHPSLLVKNRRKSSLNS